MRVFAVSMIIIINFITQSTLLQHFRILEILPNTSLIIVVVFSILWGKKNGAIIGFFTGMLQDVLLGNILGANALLYMLIGYNIGVFEKAIFKDNNLTPVFFSVIATILYHFMYYVMMYLTNHTLSMFILFRKIILLELVYNAIISIFIYKMLYNFTRHPKMRLKTR